MENQITEEQRFTRRKIKQAGARRASEEISLSWERRLVLLNGGNNN
jgi:hypothetical protein